MRPKPRAPHHREHEAREMERRRQVHGERLLPFGRRQLLDRREVPHHRIVHQDVDAAEARGRGGDEPFDLRQVRDVGLLIDHRGAGTARERVARRAAFRLRHDAVEHDVASGRRQAPARSRSRARRSIR